MTGSHKKSTQSAIASSASKPDSLVQVGIVGSVLNLPIKPTR